MTNLIKKMSKIDSRAEYLPTWIYLGSNPNEALECMGVNDLDIFLSQFEEQDLNALYVEFGV